MVLLFVLDNLKIYQTVTIYGFKKGTYFPLFLLLQGMTGLELYQSLGLEDSQLSLKLSLCLKILELVLTLR